MKTKFLATVMAIAVVTIPIAALAQDDDGLDTSKFHLHYKTDIPKGFIHFAKDAEAHPNATGLPTWRGSFNYKGKSYGYTMLGKNPATGTSSTLPVVFVPLIFKINGVTFDPTKNVNQFAASEVTLLEQSPVFTPYPISAGPTHLGTTQYLDAFMRANFWGSAHANGYHLNLSKPTVTKPVTLVVPSSSGSTKKIKNPPYNSTIGMVELLFYFEPEINKILARKGLGVSPNQFVLFVYYNVFFYELVPSQCCVLGFHNQDGNFTYGVAAFNDPGEFGTATLSDIEVITHEIGEAINDPSGMNSVPAWGKVGQVTGCQSNLEVGDAVTGTVTTINGTNGFTYHPEDLVFVNWFSRTSPSPSVNGWYTFLNTFKGDAKPCPPGGTN